MIFRESEKASVVLQKYWRGYIIRKVCNFIIIIIIIIHNIIIIIIIHNNNYLSQKSNQKFCQNTKILVPGRQGLWKMCCSLQKQVSTISRGDNR